MQGRLRVCRSGRNRPPPSRNIDWPVFEDMAEHFDYVSSLEEFSTEEKCSQNLDFVKRVR